MIDDFICCFRNGDLQDDLIKVKKYLTEISNKIEEKDVIQHLGFCTPINCWIQQTEIEVDGLTGKYIGEFCRETEKPGGRGIVFWD